jgi:predicted small metal-binding protein
MKYKLGCLEDCGYRVEAEGKAEVVDRMYDHLVTEHARPVDRSELRSFPLPA